MRTLGRAMVVLSVCLIIVLVCSAQAGQAQTGQDSSQSSGSQPGAGPTSGSQTVPDYAVYRVFFVHLEGLQAAAAHYAALGKDGSAFRHYEQKRAGLTDAEADQVTQVALDCNSAVAQVVAQMQALIASLRAQNPNTPLYKVQSPEMEQLFQEKDQIISDHIAQLKSLLGDASFQKLDTFVQAHFTPHVISLGQSSPGSPSPIKVGDTPGIGTPEMPQ